MQPSLVTILDGVVHKGESKLTLTVELLHGLPNVNDCVFFSDGNSGDCIIHEINKTESRKKYELVMSYYDSNWIPEYNRKHYPDERQRAICGLTVNDFHNLTTKQKAHYYSALVDIAGVGRVPEFLKSHMQSTLKFAPAANIDATGLTKFGGLPIAPNEFTFPKDNRGKSLLFIGQMHVGELKQHFKTSQEFKGKGILYFFGTISVSDDKYHGFESIVVLYSEATKDLVTIELPADLTEYGIFEETGMVITEEITMPDCESSLWTGKELTEEEYDSSRIIDGFVEYYNWSRTVEYLQLLGCPQSVQHCVLLEAEIKHSGLDWPNTEQWKKVVTELTPKPREWKVVLTLDIMQKYFRSLSNFKGIFNEHMDGWFYVMIKKADFDAMNFKNTVSIYQST